MPVAASLSRPSGCTASTSIRFRTSEAGLGRWSLASLPSSLAIRRRGSPQDCDNIYMATFAEDVEEDTVVANTAAVCGLSVCEVHDVALEGITAHALDGSVDAAEVASGQLIELLLRAFGEADAPGVRRARLGTAHKGSFHRQPHRHDRV